MRWGHNKKALANRLKNQALFQAFLLMSPLPFGIGIRRFKKGAKKI
jgi:hypothetical protein